LTVSGNRIEKVAAGEKIGAIGIGFPGIIRNGVVEDSPNLHQAKGFALQAALSAALAASLRNFRFVCSMTLTSWPAGIAANPRKIEQPYPRLDPWKWRGLRPLPSSEGIWEGGHSVVTLDPKENFCGCGGRGHLEGILGRPLHAFAFPRSRTR